MKKEAIGIVINGREVKIAHAFRDKHRLGVDFLESSIFTADIDAELKKKEEQPPDTSVINEDEDIFATKSPYETKSPLEKETGIRENIDILYSLLSKFAASKIKVAFNISPSRVTYQELDSHLDYNKNVFKGNLKKKIEGWKKGFNALDNVSVITRKDGTLCNVFSETYQPPILDILEQLNSFFKGNLFLSLMDSNEVSLVNLARTGYDFSDPTKITAIVQIETEFSRIIFMKGEDLLTVSPIINESFNPEIVNIIYSKIIYELDNSNIPEVSNILLAGRASSVSAKSFFEKKFPEAKIGFIIAQPLADTLSSQFSREDLSTYAIPISLAWKAIDSDKENFIPTNLLPSQIIDRQKVLTLSFAGYLLLILLGITTFIMTWKMTAKKIEISNLRRESISLQEQINKSESTVNRVHEIEAEIAKLKKRIVLSDSLSNDSDRLLTFLEKLNKSVLKINSIWIEAVQNTNNGILINGKSLKRGDVPRISEELGGAKITKLVRSESGGGRSYTFQMEINWNQPPSQFTLPKSFELEKPSFLKTASAETPSQNSKTSDWGTTTIATQTVIAEEDVGQKQEDKTVISNVQFESSLALNDKNQLDRFSETETSSVEPSVKNKFEYGKKTKIENNRSPDVSSRENYASQEKDEPRSNNNSHFTIKISAHANKFTAKKEVAFYRSKGFDTYITTLPNSSREIPYWVCLGDFATYDEAQKELIKLNRVISGKRVVVKISENGAVNQASSPLSLQTEQKNSRDNNKPDSRLIKKANHTELSYPNDVVDNEQNLINSNSGYFTVRISAHVTKFTANKEVKFYRSKGYDTYITQLPNSSKEIPYSVCLGYFNNYAEAENKIKELMRRIPRNYNVILVNK